MRATPWLRLETSRIAGPPGSAFGAFAFIDPKSRVQLRVIASADGGWEHVSVSTASRCPTWDEMCRVKELFWTDEECVVQYHPPRAEYVNTHPYCLHLWRPTTPGVIVPRPPRIMV